MRMRWPFLGLNSLVAPFTEQKLLVLQSYLQEPSAVHCSAREFNSKLRNFFLLFPVLCFDAEFLMQTKTLENAVSILSKTFLGY